MADTTFIDSQTPVVASWLNDVNDLTYSKQFPDGEYAITTPTPGSVLDSDNVSYQPAGTGAVATTVQDKLRESISVKDFGAVGDGVTDDGPSIQLAINAASANKATLNFSGGTYLIKTAIELKSNVTLIGQGNTVLFVDKSCTLGPSIGGTGRAIYTSTGQSNISIYGITFQSTKTSLTKVVSIALQDVTNLRIENCKFLDFGDSTYYAQGLIVFGSSNVTVLNNLFDNCSGDGGAFSDGTTNFEFRGNTCSNNGDWGFAFSNLCSNGTVADNLFLSNTSTGTGADECVNMVFENNVSSNNEYGIRIARFGVTTDPQQFYTITGNVCKSCDFGISIESLSDAGFYTCVGNTIIYSTNQGIRIVDTGAGTIVGNQISSSGAEGILFNSYVTDTGHTTVTGNYISVCTYGVRQLNSGTAGASKIVVVGNEILGTSTSVLGIINADYIDGDASSNYFSLNKTLNLPSGIVATTATAGGTASPGNFQGFIPIYLGGTLYKIPFFNA